MVNFNDSDSDDDMHVKDAYTTPGNKAAFSGVNNVHEQYSDLTQEQIKDVLSEVRAYTLHREVKKVRKHNPFFIYFKRQQIQMDLIDISSLKKWNDGITFLLVAIDCATKKAWCRALLNKSATTTLRSIKLIINEMDTPPKSLFFDKGREFINRQVREAMHDLGIKIYHPNSELKAAIAERFNRTLQDLIFKYLTHNETNRYIDVLHSLLETYNSRGHRTLSYMSPNEADLDTSKNHVISVLNHYYTQFTRKKVRTRFKVGDVVRVAKMKSPFYRGYNERFSRDLYEVVNVHRRMPIPTFVLKSLDTEEVVEGRFYNNELQKVLGDIYRIEKVLKKRTYKGKKQIFVKWQDFSSRHNSWNNVDDTTHMF
jgi:hypothetical protein